MLRRLNLLLTHLLSIGDLRSVIDRQLFARLLLNHGDNVWRLDGLEREIVWLVKLPPQVVQLWRILMRLVIHSICNEVLIQLISASIAFLRSRSLLLLICWTLRLLQQLLLKLPRFRRQHMLLLRLLRIRIVEIVLVEIALADDALLHNFRYLIHKFVL